MDTSDLTGASCGGGSPRRCWASEESGKLALTLLTFGFKNGPPRDADLTLDVRFLPNPHYVDELRPLTGMDEQVRAYVESGTQAGEFYGRLLPLLEFLVPAYVAEGKSHLTIAVGCTGGRHRSVTVADRIRRDLAAARGRDRAGQAPRRRARLTGAVGTLALTNSGEVGRGLPARRRTRLARGAARGACGVAPEAISASS